MRFNYSLNNKGMSLLEVLVGMIILALGILGLAPMMVTSIEGNTIARDNIEAANLLKQRIEFYEGLDSIPGVPFSLRETGLRGQFARTTAVADNASDTTIPAGVYQVDVQIDWTDHLNKPHTRSYSTYVLKG